jgi:hypothetical protein
MSRIGAALVATAAFSLGGFAPAQAAPGNGANQPCGPYCHVDGTPSNNGNYNNNNGKEAGSVGNADNKYPPGQATGPEDHNNGYECDGNKGVALGNPAHSGCDTYTPPPPPDGGGS